MENSDNELSSDDSDYNPVKNQELASEDSAPEDEPIESDDEDAQENSTKKRKQTKKQGNTKAASSGLKRSEEKVEIDPEEEKRKADAIWAEFLGESETPAESKTSGVHSAPQASSSSTKKVYAPKTQTTMTIKDPPVDLAPSKIFEFAGETVEIPSKSLEKDQPVSSASKIPVKRPSGGGLSSVLNQLTKKSKLSVLEKTKLDWDGFKSNEGINEELQTHNRGRDGFLERKDFLNRTDLRQFEIEKNLRTTTRRK